jgi:ammonium transporter, Amt family
VGPQGHLKPMQLIRVILRGYWQQQRWLSAFVVTNTAAAAAALTWMALSWVQNRRPSALATVTRAVCGLVAITPASGYVGPLSSIAIGVLGGLVTYLMLLLRTKRCRSTTRSMCGLPHGMGGLTGALLTGVFAEKVINSAGANGLLFGNPRQLLAQILAVVATAAYAFVLTFLLLKLLSVMGLRVTSREEAIGLDIAAHGEEGYRIMPREEMPEPDAQREEETAV